MITTHDGLNIVRYSVFELTVGTGQTNIRGVTQTHNAASQKEVDETPWLLYIKLYISFVVFGCCFFSVQITEQ